MAVGSRKRDNRFLYPVIRFTEKQKINKRPGIAKGAYCFITESERTASTWRRSHRAAMTGSAVASASGSVALPERVETIGKRNHEVTRQGIVLRIIDIVGGHASLNILEIGRAHV